MNNDDWMKNAINRIERMTPEEFHLSFFGFTKEEEAAYTEEKFLEELNYLRTFFVDGSYCFEPKYNGAPEAKVSKLFWNHISKNKSFSYDDTGDDWPTSVEEVRKYNLRLTHISGQGTITIVEDFDYTDPVFIAQNAGRMKREAAWNHQRKIDELLKDKPNYLDEVQFSTVINGTEITDTGIVVQVYTKKDVVRYLIDSVNNGNVIVYYNEPEKYPQDAVTVTTWHPDNY